MTGSRTVDQDPLLVGENVERIARAFGSPGAPIVVGEAGDDFNLSTPAAASYADGLLSRDEASLFITAAELARRVDR